MPPRHPLAFLALAIALASAARARAQPYHLEDSLRGGSSGGNVSGGSFGPDGWTVTAVDDSIWYALPRLGSGSIEFTMANVSFANLPLGDHEVFAMYEDGYGLGEPIHYAPEYRLNHYKIMMRIYGTAEPGRAGSIKLMWGICPSGAPGHSECGCASFFEEPFDDPGPWTGAPVRIRIEWGDGRARLLRDGVEVVGVDWSGTGLVFGPQELHMMLGSPRNDGSFAAMPIGAVFSDLVVDGMIGPLATCGGPEMPDAGPPIDAGPCDTAGVASADGTAASWAVGVYPDATDLNVEGDGSAPTAIVYLRFPPPGGTPTSATLTLHTSSIGSAAGGSGRICRVDGGAWDEATLTWSTRPTVSTVCAGSARRVSPSSPVTWDVTSLLTGTGEQTLAIVSTDADGAHYLSREAGGCELGPRLDVEVVPTPDEDAGATPGIDGGPVGGDAGRRTGGMVGDGCACRAGRGPRSSALAILGALVATLALRRRLR
jgi:hypothetical protein